MKIRIPNEVEPAVRELAVRAGFASADLYVLSLISREVERLEWESALREVADGKYRPWQEFDAEFRSRNGVASDKWL